MEPTSVVDVDESSARPLLRLLDDLEEQDDVNEVHANFDIPEEILETVA
jgi:transcriptional/translational regulatory protein YebC/TACO1